MDLDISPEQLKRMAVHEASHAVMAVLRGLPCWGIFFQSDGTGAMPCCVVTHGNPLGEGDYLQAAAGAAGELIVFNDYFYPGTKKDRTVFGEQDAPSWDNTVEEARIILTTEREKIQTLATLLEEKVKHTPDSMVKARRMDGDQTGTFYRELLPAGKLYRIMGRSIPSAVAKWLRKQLGR
jgi:hypothetical protein